MLGCRSRVDKSTAQRGLHSASKSMYHQGLVCADSLCCGGITSIIKETSVSITAMLDSQYTNRLVKLL